MSQNSKTDGFKDDWELAVSRKFDLLRAARPDLTHGKTPLNMGSHGVIIADEHSVTKVIFDPSCGNSRRAVEMAQHEVWALSCLNTISTLSIEIPRLIKPLEIFDAGEFVASFSMTKISGNPITYTFSDDDNEAEYVLKKRARNAGALMAQFHRSIRDLDLRYLDPPVYNCIQSVPCFGDKINERLLRAEKYYQANKQPGNIHGDFHAGNILWQGDQPTGLIDFSFTGRHENMFSDFMGIPYFRVDDVIEGYEQESGTVIRHMVAATQLCFLTYCIGLTPQITAQDDKKERIRELLDTMDPVL